MDNRISTRDIWLRHTATNGKSHVQEHRVWDGDKFVKSQQADAADMNAKVKDPAPRNAKVEQITEEQYRAARKAPVAA